MSRAISASSTTTQKKEATLTQKQDVEELLFLIYPDLLIVIRLRHITPEVES